MQLAQNLLDAGDPGHPHDGANLLAMERILVVFREVANGPEVPGGVIAAIAVVEAIYPADYAPVKVAVVLAVALLAAWFAGSSYAARKRLDDQHGETREKLDAQHDETHQKLDGLIERLNTLDTQVVNEQEQTQPGLPREGMELSRAILGLAKEMRPFDYSRRVFISRFTGPDSGVLQQFDAANRSLIKEAFDKALGSLYDKRFGTRVAKLIGEFRGAGMGRKMVENLDRVPKNILDLEILAEQWFGLSKTLRDCKPLFPDAMYE